MFGIDKIADIATRAITAYATGGMSELARFGMDMASNLFREAGLPQAAVDIMQTAYERGFGG